MNAALVAAAYLFIALGLENGVFPLLGETFGAVRWGEAHLVAVGVILAGAVRGELQVLLYAAVCGVLAGSVPGPGYIGPTLLSFTLVGFGGALAAHWFFLDRFGVRLVNFYILLVLESLIRSIAHQALWGGPGPEALWVTNGLVALLAAGLYTPVKRSLGERSLVTRTLGRRGLSRGR